MDHRKHILSYTRRALDDYGMIRPGDRIAVGVSAGKDSLTLLCALAEVRRFYPIPFALEAITVDMNFGGKPGDFSAIAALCEKLKVPYRVVPSDIATIVFDIRKEPNPCSLCAKLRRGALHNAAKADGCTTVALGHHFDDAVETFLLSLLFEGRIHCFRPVTYMSRSDVWQIRPMIYAGEKKIQNLVRALNLPVVTSTCPVDRTSKRSEVKALLTTLSARYPDLKSKIFGAMQRLPVDGWAPNQPAR